MAAGVTLQNPKLTGSTWLDEVIDSQLTRLNQHKERLVSNLHKWQRMRE